MDPLGLFYDVGELVELERKCNFENPRLLEGTSSFTRSSVPTSNLSSTFAIPSKLHLKANRVPLHPPNDQVILELVQRIFCAIDYF